MYNKNTLQLQYKYNNITIHYANVKFSNFQILYEIGQLWVLWHIPNLYFMTLSKEYII